MLSAEARTFILNYIPTLSHLQSLILIYQTRPQKWSLTDLSRELRTNENMASKHMSHFVSNEILNRDPQVESYFFESTDKALISNIDSVIRDYNEQRVNVIDFIYSQPTERIRSFADAFRIKKKD